VRRATILGLGSFLPEEVRRNDWWPAELVNRWMEARRNQPPMPPPRTPAAEQIVEAMRQQAFDPFQGVAERRVMAPDMESVDMEERACDVAIQRAGIDRSQIDALFTHTAVPAYLMSNTACVLHQRLGLPSSCFSMQAEAAGFSFIMQLSLAEQMVVLGRARYVLCVQSCAASRLVDQSDPHSPLLGDGASAVIVGPSETAGVLASVFRTDGRHPRALVAEVPGRRWYDEGKVILHRGTPGDAVASFLEAGDKAQEVIGDLLQRAGVSPSEIAFFGSHQGTPWMREVVQRVTGLSHARAVDVFATSGYMLAVSIPLVLERGMTDGSLRDGDLAVLFGGGVGYTYGATLVRWGAT